MDTKDPFATVPDDDTQFEEFLEDVGRAMVANGCGVLGNGFLSTTQTDRKLEVRTVVVECYTQGFSPDTTAIMVKLALLHILIREQIDLVDALEPTEGTCDAHRFAHAQREIVH